MLIVLGLTLLLIILRFDAERFDAAEYDDIDRWGRPPSLLRRIAWYLLGIGGVFAASRAPGPVDRTCSCRWATGPGRSSSASPTAAIGPAVALGIALFRYRYLRLPAGHALPGRFVNAIATAFIDEAVFRGICSGPDLDRDNPNLANLLQAIAVRAGDAPRGAGRPCTCSCSC